MSFEKHGKDIHPVKRNIKAVIFDMDNTLFDFIEAKTRACKAVTEHLGKDDDGVLFEYFFRKKYDVENTRNMMDYLKDIELYDPHTYDECCEIYHREKLENIKIYDGVKETLGEIRKKGLKIAVLTDATDENAEARINKLEIGDHIDILVTYDTTGIKKPDHRPFLHTIEELGFGAEEIAMVGDSLSRDMAPGKDIGFLSVYARYGDRNINDRSEPNYDSAISCIEELPKILGLK